jgi:hypothetical protein
VITHTRLPPPPLEPDVRTKRRDQRSAQPHALRASKLLERHIMKGRSDHQIVTRVYTTAREKFRTADSCSRSALRSPLPFTRQTRRSGRPRSDLRLAP